MSHVSTDEQSLVERLRFLRVTAKFKYAKDEFFMVGQVMHEAAAEIERLRNDIQELTCGDPRKVCPNCRGGEHG